MTGRQSEDSAALLIDQGLTVVCVIVVYVKPDALSDPAHLVVCTMSYTPYVLRLTFVWPHTQIHVIHCVYFVYSVHPMYTTTCIDLSDMMICSRTVHCTTYHIYVYTKVLHCSVIK